MNYTSSIGLIGDLCSEAEWMYRRAISVRRALIRCKDKSLEKRLVLEVDQYNLRCQEILRSTNIMRNFMNSNSIQITFLIDLVNLTLSEIMSSSGQVRIQKN